MGTGRRRRKGLDGRPMHGYGVLLESNEGRFANSDVAAWGLLFGPLVTVGGVGVLLDDSMSRFWYCGVVISVAGAGMCVAGVFITVRGFRRWRRNRAAEKAAIAAAEGKPVPRIKLGGRKRY